MTVALIRGHCVGGGVVLAASCDVRWAAADARFIVPELEVGIPLGWGGWARLIALVGESAAVDWVLTGRTLSAEEALAAGFVSRVLAADGFDETAGTLLQQVVDRPRTSLRTTKRQLSEIRKGTFDPKTDADGLLEAFHHPEVAAHIRRYIETRIRKRG